MTWLLAQEYKSLVVFCHTVVVVYINKIICFKYCVVMDEFRECLLLFGAESFVFQFAIQKLKEQDIQNYISARCPVWV